MKAFPTSGVHYTKNGVDMAQDGMELRDYFAAKAMQGLISDKSFRLQFLEIEIAKASYEVANAMMKAREQ